MTPVEIGLTVAVVVLAFVSVGALVWAWIGWERSCRNYSDHTELLEKVAEIARLDIKDTDDIHELKRKVDSNHDHAKETRNIVHEVRLIAKQQKGRMDEFQAALQELAAKHLPVHASHELLTVLEGQIAELRDKVAGMQVNREVLTEPSGELPPVEEIWAGGFPRKVIGRYKLTPVRPEALADAAHAACEVDTRRWRTETANDPAGDDGEDEQVTELGEPTFVEIKETA